LLPQGANFRRGKNSAVPIVWSTDSSNFVTQNQLMKTSSLIPVGFALLVAAMVPAARAQLNIPSDGSDGALVITTNTVIDLSQAVTASWDANNSANAGKGIYDSNKWAVVFKYSSVVINTNCTVTFSNHASRAPVVWLVSGNVTIDGTLSLDGQQYQVAPLLAEPGPGGFRGGAGKYAAGVEEAAGFGPGGGAIRVGEYYGYIGAGGSYGSVGYLGRPAYGNPSLVPLVGGSGGGGRSAAYGQATGKSGGAGAGAMLIASAGSLSISGTIRANGGNGQVGGSAYDYPGGSGGGIRLVCETLAGNGIAQCLGGNGSFYGGLGRIRIERVVNSNSLQVNPDPSVVTLAAGTTPLIWLPTNGPTARIVSIGALTPPADPRSSFGADGADVTLPQVSSTPVVVETVNVESASVVKIRVTPRANGNFTETNAVLESIVSSDPLVIRWTNNVTVTNGYSAIQARVVRP
jgi:hypothetical protein